MVSDTEPYACRYCERVFKHNFTLRRHVKQSHNGCELPVDHRLFKNSKEQEQNEFPNNNNMEKESVKQQSVKHFTCDLCDQHFTQNSSLRTHLKRAHPTQTLHPDRRMKHCIAAGELELEFQNTEEFQKWKLNIERSTQTRFIRARSDTKTSTGTIRRTFVCHRSGLYRPKGCGVRHLKVQGSLKIGFRCSSSILMKLFNDGTVKVLYNGHHVNHGNGLAHMSLLKQHRAQIAGMLAAGIPHSDILVEVRRWGGSSRADVLHMIRKKDLFNIARDFNVHRDHMLHKNDADSVAAWVESQAEKNVRLIKWQGDNSDSGLHVDDFMLVIMSDQQVSAVRKFCGHDKEAALDSTHGTNAYNFQLTTLMVIDDHGEGYPGAFCYSTKVDETSMRVFLSVVRNTLGGPLKDVVLMTDDAEAYANAWCAVMGPPAHRLLCVWHVDRAWRTNIKAKVRGDGLLKATVYKTLRAILEIRDVDTFSMKLSAFIEAANEDLKTYEFADYFIKEYAHRPHQWAYCYRIGLHVHHNMHLEALHRVLKYVHLDGKKVRRLDLSVRGLMRLMSEKDSDRLLKIHRGKWTRQLLGIRQRHSKSLKMPTSLVDTVKDNIEYTVRGRGDEVYIVEQNSSPPHAACDCTMKCMHCAICIHSFTCTCVDSGLRNTICKHVHLVMRSCSPSISTPCPEPASGDFDEQSDHDADGSSPFFHPNTSNESQLGETEVILGNQFEEKNHQQSLDSIEETIAFLRLACADDARIAREVCQQLARVKALVIAHQHKPTIQQFPTVATAESSNKKLEPQRQFWSIKRKPLKRPELSLSKPSAAEKSDMLEALDGNVEVKSQCNLDTDHNYLTRPSDHILFEHCYSAPGCTIGDSKTSKRRGSIRGLSLNRSRATDVTTAAELNISSVSSELRPVLMESTELDDKHMHWANITLKRQFPSIRGLQSTLLCQLNRGFVPQTDVPVTDMVVQIHHVGDRHHWLTSARLPGSSDVVVYDSLLRLSDEGHPILTPKLKEQLENIYGQQLSVRFAAMTQQSNSTDCGLYAIAVATDLCNGGDLRDRKFTEISAVLRRHLLKCMSSGMLTPFP